MKKAISKFIDRPPDKAPKHNLEQSHNPRNINRITGFKSVILLLITLLSTANAQASLQVTLSSAQLQLVNSQIGVTTTSFLELFRTTSGKLWAPNFCYELYVASPYNDQSVYQTFSASNPPVCSAVTNGFAVTCTVASQDVLTIIITSVTFDASSQQSLQIQITNFNTPFSSQLIKTVNVRYYSDAICSNNRQTASGTSIVIQQGILPTSNIVLASSSNRLGNSTSSNTLNVTFTPKTTMSPSGKGAIEIGIPYWYLLGSTGQRMYPTEATNKCSSTCMKITSSAFQVDRISIQYDNMVQQCIRGTPITISCRQFYNPITPQKWTGFFVVTYDSEVSQRVIEMSNNDVFLDATNFLPNIIPISNFIIDPTNLVVSSYSSWTMSLKSNIPLMPDCWIQIFLPPDFGYRARNVTASGIFMKSPQESLLSDADLNIVFRNGGSIPKSSVFFKGCQQQSALGKEPFGRLDITEISTQSAVKDSETFGLRIWKDQNMTMLIAQLEDGLIVPATNIVPGTLSFASITPLNYTVQRVTDYTIVIITKTDLFQRSAVTVRMPAGVVLPQIGTLLSVSSPDQTTNATIGVVLAGNMVQVIDFVSTNQTIVGGTQITFVIQGITNQLSAKDAGDFQIITQNMILGQYYTVDQTTFPLSFVAVPGNILQSGPIISSNPTNNVNYNTYSLTFTLEDSIPKAGYILVNLPPEIVLSPSTTMSTASCKVYTCLNVTSQSIRFLITSGISAGTVVTLNIGGVTNPRSFQPSGSVVVTTLDSDSISLIDVGYKAQAKMQVAGSISSFNIQQSNFTNGATNSFTFSVQSTIPVIQGDQFQFTLPTEMSAPANVQQMNCKPTSNIVDITCSVTNQTITIVFNEFSIANGAFSWTIDNIQNPGSTKPSSPFSEVNFLDTKGFIVSSYTISPVQVTNKFPSNLQVYNLQQDTLNPSTETIYKISFITINAIPPSGSIQFTYPQQITLVQGAQTVCTVTTTVGVYNSCIIDDSSRTVTIQNFVTNSSYSGNITIQLDQVRNPINNKPGNGFVIQTYWDNKQTFIMDKLNDFIMLPQFQCSYPCQSCSGSKQQCTSCWGNSDDPQYLMTYLNNSATCRPSCDLGFTTNGSPNKQCVRCDQSCTNCRDNGIIGDFKRCIDCNPGYPFRISLSDTCLQQCTFGLFQSTNNSCSPCANPCAGCVNSESTCTACNITGTTPFLFVNQCIQQCTPGYIPINNVCTKCQSPCSLCSGTTDNCTLCDGSGGTKFIYLGKCYADCPLGSGPNADTLTCFKCPNPICDLCDIQNQTKCLKCKSPLLVYQGDCVSECPSGWHINEDFTSCRPWQLSDMGVVYFPFLIIGAIFTLICLIGLVKKRAYLSHGKMALRSPQNTITCIIIALAPLQFLATICQWILSYIYGTMTFAILALIVTFGAILVNIAFQIWFSKHFNTKIIPKEIDRKVRLSKITQKEALKFQVDRDDKFISFKRQHRCFTYSIFALTASVSFKFNKAYYSFFYDVPLFQAQFTQAKYYRKMMTWYQIAYIICIDLSLICIDITGLTKVESGNQLYITMIETLVLSILSIILGSIELWKIKEILAYTEPPRNKNKKLNKSNESSSDNENLDKKFDKEKMKDRREMMGNLLKQVKHNKQLFLNNKLDELLTQFGDRKCKSMMDLGTGWNLEDDPRMIVTWPISPYLREEYAEMDLKFTKYDAYGAQGNNVYADAKSKYMGMDFGTQDDQGYNEFQDALNRKHGGLMSHPDGEIEERRLKRNNKRRGRKNKYYAQIDHEDDHEVDYNEATDNEGTLQIIKEQEEEEDNMRKAVAAQAQQQQEAAQQRKKQIEVERASKLAQESVEAELRKTKAIELERIALAELAAQAEKTQQAAILSLKLQQEAIEEQKKREEEEQLRAEQAALASKKAREEYEIAEAARIAVQKQEQARLAAENEAKQKLMLEAEKIQKLQAIEEAKRLQAEKDAQDLKDKLQKQQEEEAKRAAEKERLRLEKEASLRTKQQQEEFERAQKQKIEEERVAQELKKKQDELAALELQKQEQIRAQEIKNQELLAAQELEKKAEQIAAQEAKLKQDQQAELERAQQDKINFAKTLKIASAINDLDHDMPTLEKVQSQVLNQQSQRKDNYSEMNQSIQMASQLGDNFNAVPPKQIDIPPNANLRTFNVNDILGDLDRDDKGNVVVAQDETGTTRDKQGNLTNQKGYLIDPKTGSVIENLSFQQMFTASEIDERGELPAPFSVEKYNFNPHQLMGDFDYIDGKIQLMQTSNGFFIDKRSRRVNKHGWMTLAGQGHLVDSSGRKKFDKTELTRDGDLQKLFNYQGKRFDIKDVMGIFDKDAIGRIITQASQNSLVDNLGRKVNDKGYLIDESGNIIDINGKQIWSKFELKNGEFPKIFPFTRFNIKKIQGEFQVDPNGNPILKKSPSGKGFVDSQGRKVNEHGYLIDSSNNIIDNRGKVMFDQVILDNGDIPAVFRSGLLKSDTSSSLSRVMDEIERNAPSEMEERQRQDGETSLDSQMADTPANYNLANQRFEERNEGQDEMIQEEEDEGAEHMAMQSDFDSQNGEQVLARKIKRKPKKKKNKVSTIEFLQPTGREKSMAGAYGGQAIGSIRRPGIKYDEDRLQGSKKFRVATADEPKVRAQLNQLVKSSSQLKQLQSTGKGSKDGNRLQNNKLLGLLGGTGFDSQDNASQHSGLKRMTKPKTDSRMGVDKQPQKTVGHLKDGDFEQMFGKDIDQFLEDSEWDIQSMDKVSHYSRGSGGSNSHEMKLKQMERLYLKRNEAQNGSSQQKMLKRDFGSTSQQNERSQSGTRKKDVKGPDRETMINFSDDAGVIHRGEILPFATKKPYQTKK